MENKKEKAMGLFDNGCNCSQAVLLAFADEYGLDKEKAIALSVPFGGGMSKQGKTCGCLSGALMVIGLCFGKDSTTVIANRGNAYAMGKEFIERFQEEFGATDCRELIQLDLNKKNDLEQANKYVFGNRCKNMVGRTAEMLQLFLVEKQSD
ncbi:MAG: C_GCAxxG_C_C family protein [Lachnospiraceae bacterium]|nr:C_GCAxxG_C_C family protein [Lachnospiraceae bacterium]